MVFMVLIIKYAEPFLKSKSVRAMMEKIIKKEVEKRIGKKSIKESGFFVVHSDFNDSLRKIFGISSIELAEEVEKDIEKMKQTIADVTTGMKGTFAIRATRADKHFFYSSKEIEEILGREVCEKHYLKVNLKHPDNLLYVYVTKNKAYVVKKVIECFGGLPVGTEGNYFFLMVHQFIPFAVWSMMKRGATGVILVYYKSEEKRGEIEKEIGKLREYGDVDVEFVKCNGKCEEEGMKEAQRFGGFGVVLPDLTVNMEHTKHVLYPLVWLDNDELEKETKKLGFKNVYERSCG